MSRLSWQKLRGLSNLVGSEHRLIARDMLLISGFVLLAKLAAAAKEMVVAAKFGTGPVVDAYLLVFNIVNVPVVVLYSVTNVVFIPLSARLRNQDPQQEARFRAELVGGTILLGLVLVPIVWLGVHLLLVLPSLGLNFETRNLAGTSLNYLVFLIPLGLAVNFGSVLMMGRGRHANSLFEGAPAVILLIVLLLWVSGGVEALLWGTVVGTVAQLVITCLALRRGSLLSRPRLSFSSPAWADFRAGMGVMLFAQSILAFSTVIDQLFAANLGSGSISSLGYATRILALFLALGSTAIGRATLPVFSRLRHSGSDSLFRLAKQWTIILFFAGAAVALAGSLAAEWMVKLLFERGAFTAADTAEVAYALRWGLLQLPFTFAMMAASQLLFSVSRHWLAAILAITGMTLKVAFNFALIPRFGIAGLMMSTAIMQGFSCAVLLYVLRPRREGRASEHRDHGRPGGVPPGI